MSIVVPVYGCPEALSVLYERVVNTVINISDSFELILVNDGCPKNSWEEIRKLCDKDKRVIGINLSRNFGQVNATNAGLEYSTGDYVVLMDCDLQDPPEAILELFAEIEKGYDIVFAARKERKDNFIVKFCSKMFYKLYNSMVEGHYDGDIGNYCIVKRKIVNEYCGLSEHNKSFTTMLCWMGYRTSIIPVIGEKRWEGKSSYNFKKRINLAINMLTFQSNKPLYVFIKLGLGLAGLAFLYLVCQMLGYFFIGGAPSGWMSLTAVVSMLGGVQLASIGVVGIYIGNIFNEVKQRKPYYIAEIINGEAKNTKEI